MLRLDGDRLQANEAAILKTTDEVKADVHDVRAANVNHTAVRERRSHDSLEQCIGPYCFRFGHVWILPVPKKFGSGPDVKFVPVSNTDGRTKAVGR
jgi:hypothetical protein